MAEKQGHGFAQTMMNKANHLFRVFAYLWLLLTVYALHDSITLSHHPLLGELGGAALKALVLAKFMLIGEHLKLGRGLDHLRLIWSVLIKAALYSALLIALHVVEELLINAYWPSDASQGFDSTSLPVVLSLTTMAFVGLVPFFAIEELGRVLGKARLYDLFFKHHQQAPSRSNA